jgi:hypothetical protein
MGTLAAENLDVCTACDPRDSNMHLTMVKDWRLGPGMPFLDSNTCTEPGGGGGGGGGGFFFIAWFFLSVFCGLFISARVFFPVWCHPWMDDGTDGWMEKASRPWRPLLYVMSPLRIGFFPDFLLIVCFCFFLLVVSICVLICLVLLLDGFPSLILIYRLFLLLLHPGSLYILTTYLESGSKFGNSFL